MIIHDLFSSRSTTLINLTLVLIVVFMTISGEYFFRHFVLFWIPTIGNLQVNDMISLLILYALLMFILGPATHTYWNHELKGLQFSLQELLKTWEYVPWLLLLGLSAALLPFLDRFLWGGVKLMPWFTSSYKNSTKLFVPYAPIIKVVALLFVNGLFVPIAEEFIWRGIVQERLLRFVPVPMAIGITAVLFSFKHVVVDDSFNRFLFIIAFGIICGIVACRKSWRASAAVHIFANTVGSIVALATGLI
jgi:membrane protease YdiL (CAAX protease family)